MVGRAAFRWFRKVNTPKPGHMSRLEPAKSSLSLKNDRVMQFSSLSPRKRAAWPGSRFIIFLVCGLGAVAIGMSTRLEAATNDAFDHSIHLEGSPVSIQASNEGATREDGEPLHGGEGSASVWWLWHPSDDGYAVIDTFGSSFDTLLAVYFGKGYEKLDLIAVNNNSSNGVASRVVFPATSKRDYAIAVDGNLGATGNISLHLALYTTPVILQHPLSQEIVSGENADFSVKVLNLGPHHYQWQHQGVDLPGETNSTLTLRAATTRQGGAYRIIVSHRYGTAASQSAELTVLAGPVIVAQPADASREVGEGVAFTVRALGEGPLSYQWFFHETPLEGAEGASLALSNLGLEQAGLYTVRVRNGSGEITSSAARLTVRASPPRIVEQPRSITAHEGGTASFRASAAGHLPMSLQWFYNDVSLPGQNGPILALDPVTPQQGGLYYLVASNLFGVAKSEQARLTVTPPPPVQPPIIRGWGGDPAGGDFVLPDGGCRTSEFPLQVDSLATVTYQWEYNLRRVEGVTTNWLGLPPTSNDTWVPIPGATNSTLVLPNVTTAHSGAIRLVASNIAGTTTGSPGRITVTLRPIIRTQPEDLGVLLCGTAVLRVGVDGGCFPYSCQWFFGNTPLPGATNLDLALTQVEPGQSGRYRAVLRNPHGVVSTRSALVTVDTRPRITQQPQAPSSTLYDGDLFLLSVRVNDSCWPHVYQWTKDSAPLPGETNSELVLAVTPAAAAEYRVRVANEFAAVTSSPALLTVRPEPLILEHPDSQGPLRIPVGGGATLRIRAQSSSPLQYQWRRQGVNLVLDSNHQVMTNGFLLLTNATLFDSGRYDVVVRSPTGQSISRSVQVEVLPPPSNDHFAQRISLSGTNIAVQGSNVVATAEPGEPGHGGQAASHSVWWTWTAPVPCQVTLDMTGSDFEALAGVYLGSSLQTLIPVELDGPAETNVTRRVSFLAARGKTFQIAVDGKGNAQGIIAMRLDAREIIAPPVITRQPVDTAAVQGGDAQLWVEAEGSPDILYRWFFNGQPMPGRTNRVLELRNVQPDAEGVYSVRLQNEYGMTNSATARLTLGAVVRGQVTDATNRRGIPNAQVTVGQLSTFTDANGYYVLVGVRAGGASTDFDSDKRLLRLNETVRFINQTTLESSALSAEKRPDYWDYHEPLFEARPGQNVTHHFSMSPRIDGFRFVVNWGELPADLDAHLLIPPIQGAGYHVQYLQRDRGRSDAPPYATLDFDVTDGHGPETVTVYRLVDGIYRFYIKQYDPLAPGTLAGSGALVKLYTKDGLYGTRQVPTLGEGSVWHVCDIDGRRNAVNWVNQILPDDPVAPPMAVPPPGISSQPSFDSVPRFGPDSVRETGTGEAGSSFGSARFLWDFGDGSFSTEIEPAHYYPAPGTYTISLILFAQGDTNALTDSETKVGFITVYNEPPEAALTSITEGQLFRAGDPIPLRARAVDRDGQVENVDFFIIQNGVTNKLGSTQKPPFRMDYTNTPVGEYAFFIKASDNFNAVTQSQTVTVRTLDLDGDVLIVRNFADEEIESMVQALESIIMLTADGGVRNLAVRVLDQEGLRFDLVRGFKLIIWNDQGQLEDGLTENDVAVFEQARRAGIALYFMGDRLGGSGHRLSGAARGLWANLVHFLPPSSQANGGDIQLIRNRPRHEFFNQRYGRVDDFAYEEPSMEVSQLANPEGEVVATLDDRPVMLRAPAFTEPDFGQSRRVSQAFRIFAGTDDFSLGERQKLFLNVAAWLLRLTDCSSIGGFVEPWETPASARLGQPVTLTAKVTQNGECTVGGVVLTNLFSPGFEIQSCEILPFSDLADPSTVRFEIETNRVLVRFSSLGSANSFLVRITGLPQLPGSVTVSHSLHLGSVDREPVQQIVPIEAVVSESLTLTSQVSSQGDVQLSISGTPGSYVEVQESDDLVTWQTLRNVVLTKPIERVPAGPAAKRQQYFRIIAK